MMHNFLSDNRDELTALLGAFSLAQFLNEIHDAATMSARMRGRTLRTLPVEPDLALSGTRDLLIAAVANLLQNAFKFTKPGTEVRLRAYAIKEGFSWSQRTRIWISTACEKSRNDIANEPGNPPFLQGLLTATPMWSRRTAAKIRTLL